MKVQDSIEDKDFQQTRRSLKRRFKAARTKFDDYDRFLPKDPGLVLYSYSFEIKSFPNLTFRIQVRQSGETNLSWHFTLRPSPGEAGRGDMDLGHVKDLNHMKVARELLVYFIMQS